MSPHGDDICQPIDCDIEFGKSQFPPQYFYLMTRNASFRSVLLTTGYLSLVCSAWSQEPVTQFYMFGHVTSTIEQDGDDQRSDFSLGEHDFFIQSKITPRISFLSETVVAPVNAMSHDGMDHNGVEFKVGVERARLKYQYREWLSVIVGKMHTPVNYWNDVYHHGRLFFPTIDRPRAFGTQVPIHTLGLRLQGQNIGKLRFGYDLVIGNGMSSNDLSDKNLQKSITAAVHIKPYKNGRISVSAYRDVVYQNQVGAHSGHSNAIHYTTGEEGWYPVDLDFELYCFSLYHKTEKWEVLSEVTLNRTGLANSNNPELIAGLENLGRSANTTTYLYLGRKVGKRDNLYALGDRIRTQERDLHLKSNDLFKFGLGWQHDFSPLVKTQVQVERLTGRDGFEVAADDKWELKFRLAYCLY